MIKNSMKLGCILLAAATLVTGCSFGDDSSGKNSHESFLKNYEMKTIELSEAVETVFCASYRNDKFYICGSQMDPETCENTVEILTYEAGQWETPSNTLLLMEKTLSNVVDFEVLEDGSICCLVSGGAEEPANSEDVDWDAYYENFKSAWQLIFYSETGECIKTIDICDALEQKDAELTFLSIGAVSKERIYINGMLGETVIELVLEADDTLRPMLPKGLIKGVYQTIVLPDKTLALFGQDASYRSTLYAYHADEHAWSVSNLWPESVASPLSLMVSHDEDMYHAAYYTVEEPMLYYYTKDNQKFPVVQWSKLGISGDDILWGSSTLNGQFVILYTDDEGKTVPALLYIEEEE